MTDCEQNIIGDNMSLVIIRAFIIYVFVIVAVRIMGKRQVGELKPHELVITFLISSTATIPLQALGLISLTVQSVPHTK